MTDEPRKQLHGVIAGLDRRSGQRRHKDTEIWIICSSALAKQQNFWCMPGHGMDHQIILLFDIADRYHPGKDLVYAIAPAY